MKSSFITLTNEHVQFDCFAVWWVIRSGIRFLCVMPNTFLDTIEVLLPFFTFFPVVRKVCCSILVRFLTNTALVCWEGWLYQWLPQLSWLRLGLKCYSTVRTRSVMDGYLSFICSWLVISSWLSASCDKWYYYKYLNKVSGKCRGIYVWEWVLRSWFGVRWRVNIFFDYLIGIFLS